MRNFLLKSLLIMTISCSWLVLSSWGGGPVPECKKDSLAIIRVVKPINELFDIEPVVFVSTGSCEMEKVEVNDAEVGNGDLLLKQTLTDFLTNGYTIQTATETVDSGMKLNTYYLKKKVI